MYTWTNCSFIFKDLSVGLVYIVRSQARNGYRDNSVHGAYSIEWTDFLSGHWTPRISKCMATSWLHYIMTSIDFDMPWNWNWQAKFRIGWSRTMNCWKYTVHQFYGITQPVLLFYLTADGNIHRELKCYLWNLEHSICISYFYQVLAIITSEKENKKISLQRLQSHFEPDSGEWPKVFSQKWVVWVPWCQKLSEA